MTDAVALGFQQQQLAAAARSTGWYLVVIKFLDRPQVPGSSDVLDKCSRQAVLAWLISSMLVSSATDRSYGVTTLRLPMPGTFGV